MSMNKKSRRNEIKKSESEKWRKRQKVNKNHSPHSLA